MDQIEGSERVGPVADGLVVKMRIAMVWTSSEHERAAVLRDGADGGSTANKPEPTSTRCNRGPAKVASTWRVRMLDAYGAPEAASVVEGEGKGKGARAVIPIEAGEFATYAAGVGKRTSVRRRQQRIGIYHGSGGADTTHTQCRRRGIIRAARGRAISSAAAEDAREAARFATNRMTSGVQGAGMRGGNGAVDCEPGNDFETQPIGEVPECMNESLEAKFQGTRGSATAFMETLRQSESIEIQQDDIPDQCQCTTKAMEPAESEERWAAGGEEEQGCVMEDDVIVTSVNKFTHLGCAINYGGVARKRWAHKSGGARCMSRMKIRTLRS
ncbi:hypothetical protein C8R45DRAFT_947085 [Mycena sanguinolenta]|nr:hypothetical protein C8R45DRAFT_947085 [Mycena sanguinolenta]